MRERERERKCKTANEKKGKDIVKNGCLIEEKYKSFNCITKFFSDFIRHNINSVRVLLQVVAKVISEPHINTKQY